MGRPRIHANAAERQRAYRLRTAAQQQGCSPQAIPTPKRRRISRPARLAALEAAVAALQCEYEEWLESLPESLEGSVQADRLTETIDQLSAVAEALAEIQPPRGFGRD